MPFMSECGAPWNEDDDGGCACDGCRSKTLKAEREEYDPEPDFLFDFGY